MALFALTCTDKPGALALRLATREAHLAYLRERLSMIKIAGPVLNATGDPAGSLFIIEADTPAEVEALAAADPYQLAGLFAEVTIQPWRLVLGGFA
jgi:uncharacterized protein YciI